MWQLQYIPSPAVEGANPELLSSLHSHGAAEHQDTQMSFYTHLHRMEGADQHSSGQHMTKQSSAQEHIHNIIAYIAWCICLVRQNHGDSLLFSHLMRHDTGLERQDTHVVTYV